MKIIRPVTITDAMLTSSNLPETDYAQWTSGATFALDEYCIDVGTNIHNIYKSLVASNNNNPPATSPTKWLHIGKTNRWKMFDASVGTKTQKADAIINTLTLSGVRVDSVALMNISAASVTIEQTSVDGTVSITESLVSTEGINSMWNWAFEPIVRKKDFAITNLTPYANSTLTITLNDAGAIAECGACVVGQKLELGGTQYGASVSIEDNSLKGKDDFGNYNIVERSFSKTGDFTLQVNKPFVDQLQNVLAGYRAKPIVYIGSGEYTSTMILGFYKSFSIVISYPRMSICSINIEGLSQ